MSDRWIWAVVCCCALDGLALAPPAHAAHAYAMACCSGSVPSSVSVFYRPTHSMAATFSVQGTGFVATSKDGKTLYIVNENNESISVMSALTGAQTATISLSQYGAVPYGLVLGPAGQMLYVTEAIPAPGAPYSNGVYILGISTATNTVLFKVQVPGFSNPYAPIGLPPPVISSDGKKLLVFTHAMVICDLASQQVSVVAVPPDAQFNYPQGVAITPDGAYAVFTNNTKSNVGQFFLMDLSTQSVIKQINYPAGTTLGSVAVSPDGSQAYFPVNSSTGVAVGVFNISSQQVVNTYPAGSGSASAIAVTPDGRELELGESNGVLLSMNAGTGAAIAQVGTIAMSSIALSPDGSWIYVLNASSLVEIIDAATLQVSGQLPAGGTGNTYDAPWTIVASADGRIIVVAAGNNLTVIDAVHQRVVGAVPFTSPASGAWGTLFGSVSLSPHGGWAYVVESTSPPQIQVIDISLLKTVATLTLTSADNPTQSAVSPDASTLYLGEQYCPSGGSCDCYFDSCVPQLLKINTATLEITGQVVLGSTGFFPGGIAITQDGTTAYVEGLPGSGGVSVVNLAAGQVEATIPVPYGWQPIALAANQQFLYESALSNCDYYSINLPTQQVTCVNVGGNGQDIAVSPDGTLVFSTNELSAGVGAVATSPDGTGTYLGSVNLLGQSNGVAFSPF
jgi:YVTN family beta-propeller protein